MAAATPLEQAFKHDRLVVLAAIVAVATLAWIYVLSLAAQMDMADLDMADLDMAGMGMADMGAPDIAPWTGSDFLFMFVMWTVMMIGMMMPSVAPMVLIYARVARQADQQGKPFTATGWFAAGYVVAWTGFALIATVAQWGLEQAAALSASTLAVSPSLGGAVLIAAGLYQWTSFKDNCLSQCQSPITFIQRQGGFRRQPSGALKLGLRHGLYCIGCCWAIMALLFVGGVMNILWIAVLAIFVLLEKILPTKRWMSRLCGAALLVAGVWTLL